MQNYKKKIELLQTLLQNELKQANAVFSEAVSQPVLAAAAGKKEIIALVLAVCEDSEASELAADTLSEALVDVSPPVQNKAPEQLLSCYWCKRFNPELYRTFESWKCVHCQETNVNCK